MKEMNKVNIPNPMLWIKRRLSKTNATRFLQYAKSKLRWKIRMSRAKLRRMISDEMAAVLATMVKVNITPSFVDKRVQMWTFSHYVRGLRYLNDQLLGHEQLTRKYDLNFDGEKFRYVLGQFLTLMQETLREVRVEQEKSSTFQPKLARKARRT